MSTKFLSKEQAELSRKWLVIDANDQVVGRLATRVASILKGKENPSYTPNQDTGDFVVVINADKAKFSGTKSSSKIYYKHSGFTGGISKETAGELLERKPEEVIKRAVKGMLPKTTLGRAQLKKLKVYSGAEHPHQAQQPQVINL